MKAILLLTIIVGLKISLFAQSKKDLSKSNEELTKRLEQLESKHKQATAALEAQLHAKLQSDSLQQTLMMQSIQMLQSTVTQLQAQIRNNSDAQNDKILTLKAKVEQLQDSLHTASINKATAQKQLITVAVPCHLTFCKYPERKQTYKINCKDKKAPTGDINALINYYYVNRYIDYDCTEITRCDKSDCCFCTKSPKGYQIITK